jgi:hypothetical protein
MTTGKEAAITTESGEHERRKVPAQSGVVDTI